MKLTVDLDKWTKLRKDLSATARAFADKSFASGYTIALAEIDAKLSTLSESEKYVKVSDLLDYCRQAAETCKKVRKQLLDSMENDKTTSITNAVQADEYFAKELCRWEYDIPNMIRFVADGSWRKESATE